MKTLLTTLLILIALAGSCPNDYYINPKSFRTIDNDKEITGFVGIGLLLTTFAVGEFIVKDDNNRLMVCAAATGFAVTIKITEQGRSKRIKKFLRKFK